MEITVIDFGTRKEVLYGIQEMTGINNPRFYEVGEKEIDTIRNAPFHLVQTIIGDIVKSCNEIFLGNK